MTTEHRGGPVIETVVQVALLALLAYACARILSPFANLLLWALILAVTLNPLNRRLAGAVGGGRGRAATLLVLAILALIGTPTVLLTVSLAGDVVDGYRAFEAGTLAVPPPISPTSSPSTANSCAASRAGPWGRPAAPWRHCCSSPAPSSSPAS